MRIELSSGSAMPGFHIEVYTARMPAPAGDGAALVPGHVYFVSTPAHDYGQYDIYSSVGSYNPFPLVNSTYHGRVVNMRVPLPYLPHPGRFEVLYFFANYYGTVDVYRWRTRRPANEWVLYEAVNIESPHDWWRGDLYFRNYARWVRPLSRRGRQLGLNRFYRRMA